MRSGDISLSDKEDSRESSFDAQMPSHNFIFLANKLDFDSALSNGLGGDETDNISQRNVESPSAISADVLPVFHNIDGREGSI